MSDENVPSIEQRKPVYTLTIAFDTATGQSQISYPQDEVVCRFLVDKVRVMIDDEWRKRNAPLVTPPNGALKRIQFHGGPRGV